MHPTVECTIFYQAQMKYLPQVTTYIKQFTTNLKELGSQTLFSNYSVIKSKINTSMVRE